MDRVYMNHRHGERRIHIEIDEAEIADLLEEFEGIGEDDNAYDATKKLLEILAAAGKAFNGDRRSDTARQAAAGGVRHSGPDMKFCVLCLSGEHERADAVHRTDDTAPGRCGCGEPSTPNTAHRTNGPCHVDDTKETDRA